MYSGVERVKLANAFLVIGQTWCVLCAVQRFVSDCSMLTIGCNRIQRRYSWTYHLPGPCPSRPLVCALRPFRYDSALMSVWSWINPFGQHFGTIKKSDLVLVDPEGYVSPHGAQRAFSHPGYVIHHTIHKRRPDVVAAAHCHGLHGKAWSNFGRPIDILQQDACLFHDNLRCVVIAQPCSALLTKIWQCLCQVRCI